MRPWINSGCKFFSPKVLHVFSISPRFPSTNTSPNLVLYPDVCRSYPHRTNSLAKIMKQLSSLA